LRRNEIPPEKRINPKEKIKMKWSSLLLVTVTLLALTGTSLYAQGQSQNPPTGSARSRADETLEWWNHIGNRLIAMARDFPEDKYDFKVQKDERTFAENLLHVAAVDYDLIRRVSGSDIGPDSVKDTHNPSRDVFKTKADVVKLIEQAVADGAAVIKQQGDAGLDKTMPLGGKPGSTWSTFLISGSLPSSTAPSTSASWSSTTAPTTWSPRNPGANAH
jgi:hypothetical protein